MKSPTWMSCNSGMIRLALGQLRGNSSLSTQRAVYQPARCQPICTSHGQTRSAGTSMVRAWLVTTCGLHDLVARQSQLPLLRRRAVRVTQPDQNRFHSHAGGHQKGPFSDPGDSDSILSGPPCSFLSWSATKAHGTVQPIERTNNFPFLHPSDECGPRRGPNVAAACLFGNDVGLYCGWESTVGGSPP